MNNRHTKLEKTLQGSHVADVLSALSDDLGMGIHGKIFRGHSDASWKLVPSLYRSDVSQDKTVYTDGSGPRHFDSCDRDEAFFHERFFHKALAHGVKPSSNMLYDLCMMQHYGVATRLLDWSKDPLVALFFAVASCSDIDASIYAIGVNGFLPPDLLTQSSNSVDDVDRILKFEAPLFDGRVAAQKSVFTIQPFLEENHQYVSIEDRDLVKWEPNAVGGHTSTGQLHSFQKLIIPKKAKYNLLAELISFGIDKSVLFPGLQGIGESIMDVHKKQLQAAWKL